MVRNWPNKFCDVITRCEVTRCKFDVTYWSGTKFPGVKSTTFDFHTYDKINIFFSYRCTRSCRSTEETTNCLLRWNVKTQRRQKPFLSQCADCSLDYVTWKQLSTQPLTTNLRTIFCHTDTFQLQFYTPIQSLFQTGTSRTKRLPGPNAFHDGSFRVELLFY